MGGVCCTPGPEDAQTDMNVASPAPPGENTMSKSGAPTTPPFTPTTQTTPAPKAAPAPPAPASSGGGGGRGSSEGLTLELVLSDLDQAELMAYGTAFEGFGPVNDKVQLDNQALRSFLETYSGVPYNDIDTVLANVASKHGSDELYITQSDFLDIVKSYALPENEDIKKFEGLAQGNDFLSSEDCRTALVMMKFDMGAQATSVREERWESVFDAVMQNAEPTVSREAFREYLFKVARIANVVHLAKV